MFMPSWYDTSLNDIILIGHTKIGFFTETNKTDINMCAGKKLLTVVIPTYNMEMYLPQCLDSITSEIVSDSLEIIVVNDGSTDRSLDIAREYERRRPDLMKVVDKDNGNYGSCVNAGLAAATGKYFRILDADDCFDTGALIELLHRLENCNADLVVTLIVEDVYRDERKIDELHYPFCTVIKNHIYKTDEFYLHTHVHASEFRMHGMTYKTSVLRTSGLHLLEGISYTDNIYLFQPFAYIKDFIVYDIYLYHYRVGRKGQTMDPENTRRRLIDIAKVVDFQLCEFDRTPQEEHLKTNQKSLLQGSLGLFMGTLRQQNRLPKEYYDLFDRIIQRINKYGISHPLFKRKWYLGIWKKTENSHILNLALTVNSIAR